MLRNCFRSLQYTTLLTSPASTFSCLEYSFLQPPKWVPDCSLSPNEGVHWKGFPCPAVHGYVYSSDPSNSAIPVLHIPTTMPAPDGVVAPSPVVIDSRLRTPSLPAPSTVADIVERLTQIVSDYLLISPNDQFQRSGRDVLSSQIDWHIKQNVPIEL